MPRIIFTLLLLGMPSVVFAQEMALTTYDRFIYLLYGLIGFFGALSVVVFLWGFVMYLVRLGTVQREDGIRIMEWSIGLVLTVFVVIGILRFTEWIT